MLRHRWLRRAGVIGVLAGLLAAIRTAGFAYNRRESGAQPADPDT